MKVLMLVLLVVTTSACNPRGDTVEGEIVETKPHPDGTAVALIARANYGATVPYVYRVYLESQDSSATASEILRADKVVDIHINWTEDSTLLIGMRCGRIFAFKNFFYVVGQDGKPLAQIPVKLDTMGLCEVEL